jgi:hypothetical protein
LDSGNAPNDEIWGISFSNAASVSCGCLQVSLKNHIDLLRKK